MTAEQPVEADLNSKSVRGVRRALEALRVWHRYEVRGIEKIPQGGALLVVTHSLATYDILLLGLTVWEETGRPPRGLGDRMIFKTPGLRHLAWRAGGVLGEPGIAEELLREGELVFVAPGGMKESLRPSSQRYQIDWGHRRGFLKVALHAGVPVIVASCPHADDAYEVRESRLTKFIYERLRAPFPRAKGWHGTAIPKPVKLTHFLSEPLWPPEALPGESEDDRLDRWRVLVVARMERLIVEGLAEG